MNGKKAILLVLIMVLALVSAACGGNSGSTGGGYTNNDYTYDSDDDYSYDSGIAEDDTGAGGETGKADEMAGSVPEEYVTILGPGVYAFYNAAQNCYLSYVDRTLILSQTPAGWEVKSNGINGFFVCAENSPLILDIDNAYVNEGTTVKLWENTGYDTQVWTVVENENSTFSICSVADSRYCLGFENGGAVLQIRDENNVAQEWTVYEMPKGYLSVTSETAVIELQLPLDITTVISETRLQQWANNLETAYYSFYELTGFTPYDTIIVEAYKPCEYIGYVTDGSNIIHIDNTFIYNDLSKMAARDIDWNFAVLHEMGHMFDSRRPWTFEAEVMTNLKVAYVLEVNGAAAALSEFDASTVFYGADIMNAYAYLGSDFSQMYNVYACAYRFLQIKADIGWEPFAQTFHYLQENYDYYSTLSKQEMFENFISLLSYYSGVDVAGYFTSSEWAVIIAECNK